jgi:hypothetical protein
MPSSNLAASFSGALFADEFAWQSPPFASVPHFPFGSNILFSIS